jgi:hypothetical protein
MFGRKRYTFLESQNYTPSTPLRHRWRCWCGDIRKTGTYRLLQRIESAGEVAAAKSAGDSSKRTWLLPFRGELREILDGFDSRCNNSEVDIVRYYLLTCPRPMIAICVWLVGRFSDRMHLYELKKFRYDPSPQVRRHVARALRRLEAWKFLQDMAERNPDDARIQWYATAGTTHGPFELRLRKFALNVDDSHAGEVATPSRMPFWASDKLWYQTPPKSILYIRRMLRRIQRRVRWGVG